MRINILGILSGLSLFIIVPNVFANPPQDILNEAKSSFIFVFDPQTNAHEVPGKAKELVKKYKGTLRKTYSNLFKGFSANMSEQAASVLASHNPQIVNYVRNGVASAGRQVKANAAKGPKPTEQITPWGISRVGGSMDGTGRHAWILDTGIDLDHPDLNVSQTTGINCVSRGKNTFNDNNGHGTQSAGIIAAIDNGIDIVGVAAGATVHPVRVLHNNLWGLFDEIMCGLEHIANTYTSVDPDVNHHVINMSIYAEVEGQEDGVNMLEEFIRKEILSRKLRLAVCAGNESDEAFNYSPARMSESSVYTVTAIDNDDQLYVKGNYGSAVDWAAPGVGITSLKAGGGLITWSGCSYATPHVAGILLLGSDPVVDGFVDDMPIATINGMPEDLSF